MSSDRGLAWLGTCITGRKNNVYSRTRLWRHRFIRHLVYSVTHSVVEAIWNVMVHAQKQDFVFRWNGRVHLNRRGRQFIRLLAAEVCASAVVMVDTPSSEVVWRVLATHSIHQFSLLLPLLCVAVCHHISTGVYVPGTLIVVLPHVRRRYSTRCCNFYSN